MGLKRGVQSLLTTAVCALTVVSARTLCRDGRFPEGGSLQIVEVLGAPGTLQEASSLESSHVQLCIDGWGASVMCFSLGLFQKAAVACHQEI